jgi:hypothetical protein
MNDRQLRDEVATFLVAGHETTAVALSWAWHLLSTHPSADRRLHAEVAEVLANRTPTPRDLADLRYARTSPASASAVRRDRAWLAAGVVRRRSPLLRARRRRPVRQPDCRGADGGVAARTGRRYARSMKVNTKSSITLPAEELRLVKSLKAKLRVRTNVEVVRRGLRLLAEATDRAAIKDAYRQASRAVRAGTVAEIEALDHLAGEGID